jgi:hypothetical protein
MKELKYGQERGDERNKEKRRKEKEKGNLEKE